jgi:hypothetical protein
VPEDSTEAAPSAAAAGTGALWPGAIAYQDDCAAGEFDPYALCGPTVAEGVAEWNRRVGFLPLVRRTTEANYLTLRPSHTPGLGESYVGMQGGAQVVLVPDTGRLNTSVAGFLHEIGHAAGLAHSLTNTSPSVSKASRAAPGRDSGNDSDGSGRSPSVGSVTCSRSPRRRASGVSS